LREERALTDESEIIEENYLDVVLRYRNGSAIKRVFVVEVVEDRLVTVSAETLDSP
jgi:hypothetical protein